MNESIVDHEKRNGKQSLKDENRCFEIARGSAPECAAIRAIQMAVSAIGAES